MDIIIAYNRPWCENLARSIKAKVKNVNIHEIQAKKELTVEIVRRINPKFIFFPHWSYMIPKNIYNSYNCIIFHMTDLPYGRGGSPLQNLIVRGFKTTMISAIKCVKEIDAGPIYQKKPLSLEGSLGKYIFVLTKLLRI